MFKRKNTINLETDSDMFLKKPLLVKLDMRAINYGLLI